jgi:hypothetical protein
MDEPIEAVQNAVETETTPVTPPQTEVETATPQTKEAGTDQAQELPTQTEEQRKAFQEQRQEIKRLKEEVAARTKNESAFDAFRVTPPIPQFSSEQFSDPVTGEVNWQQYQAAQEAKITATVTSQVEERLRQERDEATARNKHPEVFEDPDTEQEVADRWFAAKMRGENPTITEIAAKVSKRLEKTLVKAEIRGAQKALTEVEPKEKVALTASGQSPTQAIRHQETEDDQARIAAIRYGSDDALADAMSKIPWANK